MMCLLKKYFGIITFFSLIAVPVHAESNKHWWHPDLALQPSAATLGVNKELGGGSNSFKDKWFGWGGSVDVLFDLKVDAKYEGKGKLKGFSLGIPISIKMGSEWGALYFPHAFVDGQATQAWVKFHFDFLGMFAPGGGFFAMRYSGNTPRSLASRYDWGPFVGGMLTLLPLSILRPFIEYRYLFGVKTIQAYELVFGLKLGKF